MSDKQLVLAFFADEPAAAAAASTVKGSGAAKGDAIGILVLDASGDLAVDKVGATSVAAGVGIGAALLVLGPYFLGVGVATAVVGGGIGMAGGAVGGSMHHKGLKLSDGEKARIAADLKSGKAAVGVLADIDQAASIQEKLSELGGATSAHDVVDEAALQAAAAES